MFYKVFKSNLIQNYYPCRKLFSTNVNQIKKKSFNIWKLSSCRDSNNLDKIISYFKSYHQLHNKNVNIIESPMATHDLKLENEILEKLIAKDLVTCTQSQSKLRLQRILIENPDVLSDLNKFPSVVKENLMKLVDKQVDTVLKFSIVDETNPRHKTTSLNLRMSNPELIFGVTFLAIEANSLEHQELTALGFRLPGEEQIIKRLYAINPINKSKISIILTKRIKGIKACVPAHDEIDHELAKRLNLPILHVLKPIKEINTEEEDNIPQETLTKNKEDIKLELMLKQSLNRPIVLDEQNKNHFLLTNSKEFDFLFPTEARDLVINHLIKNKGALRNVEFKIDDMFIAKEEDIRMFSKEFTTALDPLRSKNFIPIDLCVIEDQKFLSLILITRILYYIINEEKLKETRNTNEDPIIPEDKILSPSDVIKSVYYHDNNKLNVLDTLPGFDIELTKLNQEIKSLLDKNKISFDPSMILDEVFEFNTDNIMLKLLKEYAAFFKFSDLGNLNGSVLQYKTILTTFQLLISRNILEQINCVTFLYINYLLMLYPMYPELVDKCYSSLLEEQCLNTRGRLKQSIAEYDLFKLNSFITSVIDMLTKSFKVNLVINHQDKGKVTLDINLKDQDKYDVIDYLKVNFPDLIKDINWEDYNDIEYTLDHRTMRLNFLK